MWMTEWPGIGAKRGCVEGYDVREVRSHLTWGLKVVGRSEMGSHCRF